MRVINLVVIIFLLSVLNLYGEQKKEITKENHTEQSNNPQDEYKTIKAKDIIFQYKLSKGNINIRLSAPTTGWVAVGFDPSFFMKNANLIIGYVEDGNVFIRDDFGSGMFSHKSDLTLGGQDNISDKSGKEENGVTQLSFSIPLNSGDPKDKILVAGQTYKLMLSYGKTDNINLKHQKKTKVKITL